MPTSAASHTSSSSSPSPSIDNEAAEPSASAREGGGEQQPENRQVLLLVQEAVGGLSAGIVGTVLGYPLDTIKARQQILGSNNSATTASTGILGTARHIVRHEGVVGLYRGLVPPLISLSLLNTINFTLYSDFRHRLGYYHRDATLTTTTTTLNQNSADWLGGFQINNALAGAAVGMFASPISTIENLVKTQLQMDNVRTHPRYRGSRDCVQQIMRFGVVRGVPTLYTGHVVNTIREMTFLATYFGVYEGLRELLFHSHPSQNSQSATITHSNNHPWTIPLAGGLAGATAWVVSFPLDCVRAGVQGQDLGLSHGQPPPPTRVSAIAVFRNLISQRGWKGLYRGVAPSIVRAFLVSGSRFTAYEVALWFLRGGRDNSGRGVVAHG